MQPKSINMQRFLGNVQHTAASMSRHERLVAPSSSRSLNRGVRLEPIKDRNLATDNSSTSVRTNQFGGLRKNKIFKDDLDAPQSCASPGLTMASTHYIADSVEKCSPDREITHARAKRMEELAEIEARRAKTVERKR